MPQVPEVTGPRRSGEGAVEWFRNTRVATHPRPIAVDYLIHERRTVTQPHVTCGSVGSRSPSIVFRSRPQAIVVAYEAPGRYVPKLQ
jgi:hypothetical protein